MTFLKLFSVWGLVALSIYYSIRSNGFNILVLIRDSVAWVLWAVPVTYKNSSHFFLSYNKCRMFIKNSTCNFNITTIIELENLPREDTPLLFLDNLQKMNSNSKLKSMSHDGFSYISDEYLINIKLLSSEDTPQLKLSTQSNVSYRDSKMLIDNFFRRVLPSALEVCDEVLSKKHIVTLKFKNDNPFSQLYVKKIKDVKNSTFSLNYKIDNCKVAVFNKSLTISSEDTESIIKLSKQYFTLK